MEKRSEHKEVRGGREVRTRKRNGRSKRCLLSQ